MVVRAEVKNILPRDRRDEKSGQPRGEVVGRIPRRFPVHDRIDDVRFSGQPRRRFHVLDRRRRQRNADEVEMSWIRRIKFSLKSLLVVASLVAACCWWYAIGWPSWQENRFGRLTQSISNVTSLELRPQRGRTLRTLALSDRQLAVGGGIQVNVGEFTLYADLAVLWRERGTPWSLPLNAKYSMEAYLEGNVKVRGNGPTGSLAAAYLNAPNGKFKLVHHGTFASKNLVDRAEDFRLAVVSSGQ